MLRKVGQKYLVNRKTPKKEKVSLREMTNHALVIPVLPRPHREEKRGLLSFLLLPFLRKKEGKKSMWTHARIFWGIPHPSTSPFFDRRRPQFSG